LSCNFEGPFLLFLSSGFIKGKTLEGTFEDRRLLSLIVGD
jgi:hypothetical protein